MTEAGRPGRAPGAPPPPHPQRCLCRPPRGARVRVGGGGWAARDRGRRGPTRTHPEPGRAPRQRRRVLRLPRRGRRGRRGRPTPHPPPPPDRRAPTRPPTLARGGAAAARRAHNPKAGGSNPPPATTSSERQSNRLALSVVNTACGTTRRSVACRWRKIARQPGAGLSQCSIAAESTVRLAWIIRRWLAI